MENLFTPLCRTRTKMGPVHFFLWHLRHWRHRETGSRSSTYPDTRSSVVHFVSLSGVHSSCHITLFVSRDLDPNTDLSPPFSQSFGVLHNLVLKRHYWEFLGSFWPQMWEFQLRLLFPSICLRQIIFLFSTHLSFLPDSWFSCFILLLTL